MIGSSKMLVAEQAVIESIMKVRMSKQAVLHGMYRRTNRPVFADGVAAKCCGEDKAMYAFFQHQEGIGFFLPRISKELRKRGQHNRFRKQTANLQRADFETRLSSGK